MQLKRSILFRQVSAVCLLLVLLLVNIIQVAHTHTYKQDARVTSKSFTNSTSKEYHTAKAETKCFICEYQLAKDADNYSTAFTISHPVSFITATTATYSFIATGSSHFIDNRGPPATS